MKLTVEISKYPLHQDYIPYIQDFIDRLNAHGDIKVITNTLSTQVFGDYDTVMSVMSAEIKRSYETYGKAIFVCKFLCGDLSPEAS
ncbi:hypothetical protein [Pseudoalteromonas ruthenica]|uniref:hypothetical protein n=1 Tax=Pseudoalteromonas ruthenica TaxID=151081 RepID=UPI0003497A09|nr:hypothetical protein [Pseudoalteromonas ruthenica]